MRKALKILGRLVSTLLFLVIVVPLLLSVLLRIPAVQNFVVHKAAQMISEKLETTVSIDRIDIGMLNRVKVKGFYVEDYQRDTLLYVGHLDAYVTSFGLTGGGLVFSRANITEAKLYLRETPYGEMNIKQIVDRISNKKKKKDTGNFKLTLRAARIDGMDFCLEKIEHGDRDFGIDFGHLHLYDIHTSLDDFTLDGSTIYTGIRALSARERSGFVLNHLAGRFYLLDGGIGFEELSILTDRSNLTIPYVSLVGNSWAEYKDFIGQVEINGSIQRSTLSSDDVAYFAPKLRDWHQTLRDVDLRINGSVSDFTGRINSLHVGKATSLAAEVTIKGLPDVKKAHFDLMVSELTSTAEDIGSLSRSVAQKPLPYQLQGMLRRSGNVGLKARFQGSLSNFDMQAVLATGLGSATCNLRMQPKGRVDGIWGNIRVRNFQLGRLLGKPAQFGQLSVEAQIDGTVGRSATDARLKGVVSRFGFNGYEYDSLRFDGRLRNKEFDGKITLRDPNLQFDFAGQVDLNGEVPYYDFRMDLQHADLHRLKVNRRDSVSVLSGRMAAKAGGRSLDDLNGWIEIVDAKYRYDDKEVVGKQISVLGENSADHKFIELRSDFADVTFRSRTNYRNVFEYLKLSLSKYLPTLDPEKETKEHEALASTAVANDYSLLSVKIKNINPLADAVSNGLQIADGSSMQLLFNPGSDKLSLTASSEYVEREGMLVTRLNVNAGNRGDSLSVYASAEDLYVGGVHLPNLTVMGGARQGLLQVSTGFRDTVRQASGLLGVQATLNPQRGPNGRTIDLRILPSHITRGEKTWQIFAHKIQIDTAQIAIDRFYMMNADQELLVNGIASRSLRDSVTLRLRNFDLAPFSQVAEQMGYFIEGRTNGDATMKSVLKGGEISANIGLDSIRVNGIAAPPLQLESRWDFGRSRAGITLTDRNRRDTLVRGFFDPAQVRYYARVKVDSLDLGLLNPILSGVISQTKGTANASMIVQGQRREASVAGEIVVDNFATTVDFTGVTYSMPHAVLEVRNNRFRASNVPVFDPKGNRGLFGIDLNLQHLSNIAYSVRVAPQQMMVLNTTSQDNDMFYGQVFATGVATIAGNKAGVKMDISAKTDDNSTFVMPLSSKANVSAADFVTFVKPSERDTTDLLARKKMRFERKRSKETSTGGGMDINLALDIQPNLDFQLVIDPRTGSAIKGRGKGALNLHINPRTGIFEMFGDYTITEGSYLFSLSIINKKFIIESGSTIQWTGSPMNALLNIEAVYKVKASLQALLSSTGDSNFVSDRPVPVDCIIKLGDRLTNPLITFDVRVPQADPETQTILANVLSTPESIDTQFLYLLVFNSFMSEGNSSTASSSGISAASGVEFLTNQLSSLLSTDDYNVIIRYRPSSEVSSDELDFGLSKSLINNRLFVELEGNYLIDNKKAVNNGNFSNFMGEAYITYLLDRAGTLKLKAFTQTIDRFDENQGLQETGIGIYYKEEFNNFKDLRQRIKDRFSSKQRKTRKAARLARKQELREAADTLQTAPAVVKKE